MAVNTEDLTDQVVAFRDARGWEQFHTPRNLAEAISVEAGELLEVYLWDRLPATEAHRQACKELADVLIFALTMCRALGVTAESIVRAKMQDNEQRYPVASSYGNARKASDRGAAW